MDYSLDDRKMILATSALLVCMVWDIAVNILKDYVKVPSWIPDNLFVLNALTILILGNVNIEKVNVLSPSDENYLEVLVANQLRTDAARLTMCVFVGCILPKIAMAGTEGGWSSLAALFVSLAFHISTEIYALQNAHNSTVAREAGPWFVSSGVILSLGASSLLLLLGVVMLTCKVGRHVDLFDFHEPLSEDAENEGAGCETLRSQVMASWFELRLWKTAYFMINSVFSPATAMIVTICVAAMAAKLGCRSSLLHHNNEGGNLTFYLQCIFILVGWVLILCRWFKAALYCRNSISIDVFFAGSILFLVPGVVLLNPLVHWLLFRLEPFARNRKFTLKGILISISCLVLLLVLLLPLCVLILAASLLLLICFICYYFSNLAFGSQFVQRLYKFEESDSENDEYSKYLEPDDSEIWKIFKMVNKKSFDRVKGRMDEAVKIEENFRGLLSIIGSVRVVENQRLRLQNRKKHSWMRALSKIFINIAEAGIGVNMKDAFAAYRETMDALKFVDCPDNVVVDPLNIFGTLDFKSFYKSMEYEANMFFASLEEDPNREDLVLLTEEKQARVGKLVEELNALGEDMFSSPSLIKLEEYSYPSLKELGEMLNKLVGHVIVSGLLEAPDVLVKYTKKWAESLDEAKIERSIELAGKVSALLERLVQDRNINLEEGNENGAIVSRGDDVEARDSGF